MSRFRKCVASFALLGGVVCTPVLRAQTQPRGPVASEAPRLNDTAELARVVSFYEAGKYGQCADALHLLLAADSPRPFRDPDVVESARIYHAACLIGLGQNQQADEPLRAAIRQNPQMKPPDSLVFPPPVVDRFLRVRETMFDVIRKAEDERIRKAQELSLQQEERARRERVRVAGLERLAQQETIVIPKSRFLALVPFGVGQFQNDEKALGYVFLTSELLLVASTLTTLGVETHLILARSQVEKAAPSNTGRLQNWKTALEFSSYAWIGVSLVGIVEAELMYVPERRLLQKRALPPELRPESSRLELRPSAAPVPGGAVFGVSGRF